MTDETTDTAAPAKRPRGCNKATTVADIAGHKDTVAVFAYAVDGLGAHFMAEAHGHKWQWAGIAGNLADIARAAGDSDGEPIRLNVGDAQTVWYIRDKGFAVVVVLAKGSTLGKSILRMSRRALKAMAAAEDLETVKARTVADLAVARDLGSIRA